MNHSNILPGTTHVYLTLEAYLVQQYDLMLWLSVNAADRVDAFAYETDDPLDHQSLFAVFDGDVHLNNFGPELEAWQVTLETDGRTPSILFAFENDALATLFKLTWGGAA